MRRVLLIVMMTGAVASSPAWAQTPVQERADRPATATYWGDTGLWFVPTAEVIRPKGFSFSLYRTEFDFKQGLTDVSDWPVTLAVGVPHVEIFGALRAVTRIDRDTRPIFQQGVETEAGLVNDRPFVREPWSGNTFGDLFLGAKVNILSEGSHLPLAAGVRATIKVPTADEEKGAGTGKYDYFTDFIASKEIARRFEVSGFTGFAFRGDPDNVELSDGFRWGLGGAFGARANLRFTAEVFGEEHSETLVTATPGVVTATDGSNSPLQSDIHTGVTTALGLTWQSRGGVSLGAGLTYQTGVDEQFTDNGRGWGMQFRFGLHRGVKAWVPPAPLRVVDATPAPAPPPPAPEPIAAPAPAPVANRMPSVRAQCNPCRIQVGRASSISAVGSDPDGDIVMYRWTTSGGTIVDARSIATMFTAENAPGFVTLTVTADDGRGGTATDTVRIEVFGALAFEDVQFDLDQSTLRPDALAVLQRAVQTLNDNPTVRVLIEGHASEEATAEYNLALGERRADAVRAYLVGQGIAATRLSTVTYGESRPKYDNSREETRRLNRRAAFVVQGGAEDR